MKSREKASSMAAMDLKYRTEDDLRTIQRAMEVKKDPARMKRVQALAREQLKALQAVSSK